MSYREYYRQTDRQTDPQTVTRTYLPKLEILASNERAIGDCVLAKIGLDNAHCNDKDICINMDDTIFENQLGFT